MSEEGIGVQGLLAELPFVVPCFERGSCAGAGRLQLLEAE